jgi:hypothetical protein
VGLADSGWTVEAALAEPVTACRGAERLNAHEAVGSSATTRRPPPSGVSARTKAPGRHPGPSHNSLDLRVAKDSLGRGDQLRRP